MIDSSCKLKQQIISFHMISKQNFIMDLKEVNAYSKNEKCSTAPTRTFTYSSTGVPLVL